MVTHVEHECQVKVEAFTSRLEKFLEGRAGSFHVMVQPYGKAKDGIRYVVVRLDTGRKDEAQVLTGTYEKKIIERKRAEELASGPIGRLKQILGDSDGNHKRTSTWPA